MEGSAHKQHTRRPKRENQAPLGFQHDRVHYCHCCTFSSRRFRSLEIHPTHSRSERRGHQDGPGSCAFRHRQLLCRLCRQQRPGSISDPHRATDNWYRLSGTDTKEPLQQQFENRHRQLDRDATRIWDKRLELRS